MMNGLRSWGQMCAAGWFAMCNKGSFRVCAEERGAMLQSLLLGFLVFCYLAFDDIPVCSLFPPFSLPLLQPHHFYGTLSSIHTDHCLIHNAPFFVLEESQSRCSPPWGLPTSFHQRAHYLRGSRGVWALPLIKDVTQSMRRTIKKNLRFQFYPSHCSIHITSGSFIYRCNHGQLLNLSVSTSAPKRRWK